MREIKSRRLRWVVYVAHMGELRNTFRILKPEEKRREEKRPLRRLRHRWKDNMRFDLREIGGEDVEWMHLAQDRDHWWTSVNMIMNLQVP
jgi:hypothetical protein